MCHDKQEEAWGGTRITQVFNHPSEKQIERICYVRERVREVLLGRFKNLKECFESLAKDGEIGPVQVLGVLREEREKEREKEKEIEEKEKEKEKEGEEKGEREREIVKEDVDELFLTRSLVFGEKGRVGLRDFVHLFE